MALLVLHAALLWGVMFHAQRRAAQPEEMRRSTWLLPLPRAAPQRQPDPPKAPPPRRTTAAATPTERPATAKPDDSPAAETPSASETNTAPAAPSNAITRAPLRLDLPTSGTSRTPLSRPANAAIEDPRSNSPRLTPSERFAISLGTLDCVVDERQPDGTVRRFEGKFKRGPTASATADPFGHGGGSGGNVAGDFSRGLGGDNPRGGGSSFATCVKK